MPQFVHRPLQQPSIEHQRSVASPWSQIPIRVPEGLSNQVLTTAVGPYYDRKRVHNLKCYTWVEQQGKTYEEIQAQWYDPDYRTRIQAVVDPIDELIDQFNERVGLG